MPIPSRISRAGVGSLGHLTVAKAFRGASLKICFIDEAGDLGELGNPPRPNDQPVLVIGGLFVDVVGSLADLTSEFLKLKFNFFPGLPYPSDRQLDRILPEIKRSDLRRNATRGTAREYRHTIGILDHIFGLLLRHDVRMVARIWIEAPGEPFDSSSAYTSSIQSICGYFELSGHSSTCSFSVNPGIPFPDNSGAHALHAVNTESWKGEIDRQKPAFRKRSHIPPGKPLALAT